MSYNQVAMMARTRKRMVERTEAMVRRKKVEVATMRKKAVMMRKRRRRKRRKMSLKISRRSLKLVSILAKRYCILRPPSRHGLEPNDVWMCSRVFIVADNTLYRLHEDHTMRAAQARVR